MVKWKTGMSRDGMTLNTNCWAAGNSERETAVAFMPCLCGFLEHLDGHGVIQDAGLDGLSLL